LFIFSVQDSFTQRIENIVENWKMRLTSLKIKKRPSMKQADEDNCAE
jgi:hypothetical protein